MPLRYISVEKQVNFQGRTEQWSNVYCYSMGTVTLAAHQALEDAVLEAERSVHSAAIKFIRTRTFTTEGLNLGDDGTMYNITERNAFGTVGGSSLGLYLECAILVKWPLPRKVKLGGGLGRQRSLKKWLHVGDFSGGTAGMYTGNGALSSGAKAPFETYASTVRTANGHELVSASDGVGAASSVIIHPYVEHRQFPRGRKEGLL